MFKRIFWSINLRPVYSLLVILLFFVLGTLLLLGLAWNLSAKKELLSARNKWGMKAVVQVNAKKLFEAQANKTAKSKSVPKSHQSENDKEEKFLPSQVEKLTLNQADMISNLSEVKSAQYTAVSNVIGKDFKPITTKENSNSSLETIDGIIVPEFQLVGVLKSEVLDEFKSMDNILISGSDISPADLNTNNAIIEHELASKNHLKIGDSFKLASVDGKQIYTFLVSGIFVSSPKNARYNTRIDFLSEKNKIFVSVSTVSTLSESSKDHTIDKAIYTLRSPDSFEKFRIKTMQKGISLSVYDIYSDDSQYKLVSSQIRNAISISSGLTIFIFFTIFVTEMIIINLARNRRMEEIKTLLLYGESNRRIFTQFILENIILITIGLIIAIIISPVSLNKINFMLENITSFIEGNSGDTYIRTGKYFIDISNKTINGDDILYDLDLKTKIVDQVGIIFIGLFFSVNAAIGSLWKVLSLSKGKLVMNSDTEESV